MPKLNCQGGVGRGGGKDSTIPGWWVSRRKPYLVMNHKMGGKSYLENCIPGPSYQTPGYRGFASSGKADSTEALLARPRDPWGREMQSSPPLEETLPPFFAESTEAVLCCK